MQKGLLTLVCAALLMAAGGCGGKNTALQGSPAAPPARLPDLTKAKPANMTPGGATMPAGMAPGSMMPGGMAVPR